MDDEPAPVTAGSLNPGHCKGAGRQGIRRVNQQPLAHGSWRFIIGDCSRVGDDAVLYTPGHISIGCHTAGGNRRARTTYALAAFQARVTTIDVFRGPILNFTSNQRRHSSV